VLSAMSRSQILRVPVCLPEISKSPCTFGSFQLLIFAYRNGHFSHNLSGCFQGNGLSGVIS